MNSSSSSSSSNADAALSASSSAAAASSSSSSSTSTSSSTPSKRGLTITPDPPSTDAASSATHKRVRVTSPSAIQTALPHIIAAASLPTGAASVHESGVLVTPGPVGVLGHMMHADTMDRDSLEWHHADSDSPFMMEIDDWQMGAVSAVTIPLAPVPPPVASSTPSTTVAAAAASSVSAPPVDDPQEPPLRFSVPFIPLEKQLDPLISSTCIKNLIARELTRVGFSANPAPLPLQSSLFLQRLQDQLASYLFHLNTFAPLEFDSLEALQGISMEKTIKRFYFKLPLQQLMLKACFDTQYLKGEVLHEFQLVQQRLAAQFDTNIQNHVYERQKFSTQLTQLEEWKQHFIKHSPCRNLRLILTEDASNSFLSIMDTIMLDLLRIVLIFPSKSLTLLQMFHSFQLDKSTFMALSPAGNKMEMFPILPPGRIAGRAFSEADTEFNRMLVQQVIAVPIAIPGAIESIATTTSSAANETASAAAATSASASASASASSSSSSSAPPAAASNISNAMMSLSELEKKHKTLSKRNDFTLFQQVLQAEFGESLSARLHKSPPRPWVTQQPTLDNVARHLALGHMRFERDTSVPQPIRPLNYFGTRNTLESSDLNTHVYAISIQDRAGKDWELCVEIKQRIHSFLSASQGDHGDGLKVGLIRDYRSGFILADLNIAVLHSVDSYDDVTRTIRLVPRDEAQFKQHFESYAVFDTSRWNQNITPLPLRRKHGSRDVSAASAPSSFLSGPKFSFESASSLYGIYPHSRYFRSRSQRYGDQYWDNKNSAAARSAVSYSSAFDSALDELRDESVIESMKRLANGVEHKRIVIKNPWKLPKFEMSSTNEPNQSAASSSAASSSSPSSFSLSASASASASASDSVPLAWSSFKPLLSVTDGVWNRTNSSTRNPNGYLFDSRQAFTQSLNQVNQAYDQVRKDALASIQRILLEARQEISALDKKVSAITREAETLGHHSHWVNLTCELEQAIVSSFSVCESNVLSQPELFVEQQPLVSRIQFTSTLIDTALMTEMGTELPRDILNIISEYAPLPLPSLPVQFESQLTSASIESVVAGIAEMQEELVAKDAALKAELLAKSPTYQARVCRETGRVIPLPSLQQFELMEDEMHYDFQPFMHEPSPTPFEQFLFLPTMALPVPDAEGFALSNPHLLNL